MKRGFVVAVLFAVVSLASGCEIGHHPTQPPCHCRPSMEEIQSSPSESSSCDCDADSGTEDPENMPFSLEFKNESSFNRRCVLTYTSDFNDEPTLLHDGFIAPGEVIYFPPILNEPIGYGVTVTTTCYRPEAVRFQEYTDDQVFHVSMPLECFLWYGESRVAPYVIGGCRTPRPL